MDQTAKEIRSFKRWFIIISLMFLVPYLIMVGSVIYTSQKAYNVVQKIDVPNINEMLNVNLNDAINTAVNSAVNAALKQGR